MLKKIAKFMVVTAALMFVSSASQAAPKVEHARLNLTSTGKLIVIAEDGERYSRLESNNLKFEGNIDVKMKSGKLQGYNVFMGVCGPGQCGSSAFKSLAFALVSTTKQIKDDLSFDVSASDIPQGLSPNVQAANIFRICNDHARGKTADTSFTHYLMVTLGLKFNERGFDSGGAVAVDFTDQRAVPVKVVCRSTNPTPKPVSVDIRVKQKGNTCPKDTEVTAYIDYEKPMTGRFRVIHNGSKSEPIEITARKVSLFGKTWYRIERMQRYKLDPGSHTFQIKVIGGGKSPKKTINVDCPPFKVSSAWLSYKVESKLTCKKKVDEEAVFYASRPGDIPYKIETQGGLVVTQGIAYAIREGDKYVARRKRTLTMGAFDQNMILKVVNDPSVGDQKPLKVECLDIKGDFSFIDNTGTKCPRKGKALINFSMNMETNVHYSLDCTNGHFSGVAQPVPDGKGGYVAPAYVEFDIDKTTQANCALKSVSPGKTKIHALKGHLFRCYKPTFDPVTTDFTADPNPTHNEPKPTIVVDPPRDVPPSTGPNVIVDPVRVVCRNGVVRNNTCFCPRTHKKQQIGRNKWRCDPLVVDPPRTPPGTGPNVIVDPVRIVCLRGTVRNAQCFCPRRHKKVRFGKNKWRCDRVVVDPPRTPPSTGPKVIADPPRRISCRNGVVRNKTCYCSRDRKKVRVGRNAWNCVKKARVVPPKKGGSSVNSGKPKFKVAPPARTLQKPKKKKKKSKKRRSSRNSGATRTRMIRRR